MWCAQLFSLAETPQLPPPPPSAFGLIYIRWALLVSYDRRHLLVTPWMKVQGNIYRARMPSRRSAELPSSPWTQTTRCAVARELGFSGDCVKYGAVYLHIQYLQYPYRLGSIMGVATCCIGRFGSALQGYCHEMNIFSQGPKIRNSTFWMIAYGFYNFQLSFCKGNSKIDQWEQRKAWIKIWCGFRDNF